MRPVGARAARSVLVTFRRSALTATRSLTLRHTPEFHPHHHDDEEITLLFQILKAPTAAVNVEDWLKSDEDMVEVAGRRRDGLERQAIDRSMKRQLGSSR